MVHLVKRHALEGLIAIELDPVLVVSSAVRAAPSFGAPSRPCPRREIVYSQACRFTLRGWNLASSAKLGNADTARVKLNPREEESENLPGLSITRPTLW